MLYKDWIESPEPYVIPLPDAEGDHITAIHLDTTMAARIALFMKAFLSEQPTGSLYPMEHARQG